MSAAELVTYHEMRPGRVFAPHDFQLDTESERQYAALFGSSPASPLAGLLFLHARKSYVTEGDIPSGGIMARMRLIQHARVPRDEPLRIQATVAERYERRGRGWVQFRCRLTGTAGHLADVEILGAWPL